MYARCRYHIVWAFMPLVLAAFGAQAQNSAYDLNAQGAQYYADGAFDAAIQSFERAYDLEPENTVIRRNLCNAHQAAANALAKEADFAAAAKHLELAIGVDPENHAPLVQLGSYYLRLDFVPEAIARLEEAIELSPRDLDAHELLGDAYYMDNDLASARKQWEWVLEMAPQRAGLSQKIAKASREQSVEADFRPSSSRHFQFTYTPEIQGRSLRRVLNVLERAYVDIGREFGGVYPPTPIQVIVYSAKEFSAATQAGQHVGALYDGKIRLPIQGKDGAPLEDEELRKRLYHEFTHVVVRFLGGSNVPWWLNEGLAETLSRGDLETAELDLLRTMASAGKLFSLSMLDANQMEKLSPELLGAAYAQSHATVHYLRSRFGHQRITNTMSDLVQHIEPEEAIQRNYNRDYTTLEGEVSRAYGLSQ